MSFGLRKEDFEYIVSAAKRFSEIDKALIFGSETISAPLT